MVQRTAAEHTKMFGIVVNGLKFEQVESVDLHDLKEIQNLSIGYRSDLYEDRPRRDRERQRVMTLETVPKVSLTTETDIPIISKRCAIEDLVSEDEENLSLYVYYHFPRVHNLVLPSLKLLKQTFPHLLLLLK
jgi:hypothetical protein